MNTRKFLTVFCIAGALLAAAASGHAQTFWKKMTSESGLFTTDMRVEGKSTSHSMLVGAYRAVYSDEVAAVIDQRPYKPVFKNYSVRLDQTFGPGLSTEEQLLLAQLEIDEILESYAKYDYILKDRRKDDYSRYKGESISLIYNDPEFGAQGVMIRVIFANVSKITQIAIIPESFMKDSQITEFFESFSYEDGLPLTERSIVKEWKMMTSPHKIFSVQVPPKTPVFFDEEPEIKNTEDAEVMRFVFKDPVRKQNLYYNTYGYRAREKLSFSAVEKMVGDMHVRRFRRDPSKVSIEKLLDEETEQPYMRIEFSIPPTKKVPYLDSVKLHVYFNEDFIFVQEIIGSRALVDTAFVQNFMELFFFHPEKAEKLSAAPTGASTAPAEIPVSPAPETE